MLLQSINPYTGELIEAFNSFSDEHVDRVLDRAESGRQIWQQFSHLERTAYFKALAVQLRHDAHRLALFIVAEMGKPITEALAEIEKCAWACEYYAEHGERMLAPQLLESDARRSYVVFNPLGTVLAIMPWNFPFWQFFRCALAAMLVGNTVVLKHAANVSKCALAIERVCEDAGLPAGVVSTLLLESSRVGRVIADSRVHAVSMTGSEQAGRAVAEAAGRHLKKCVLELGGSDPFVVLADADVDAAADVAVMSRFSNCGQSCIAAKRMIVVKDVAADFVDALIARIENLNTGDPCLEKTSIGPMAREDLRLRLQQQVRRTLDSGALSLCGNELPAGKGFFYPPSVVDNVRPGMVAFEEEVFGPLAVICRVKDVYEAKTWANASRYGLGVSVWTKDLALGEQLIAEINAGAGFVNGLVKSDPRLPFGGVKASGYGRELSFFGLYEFANIKTMWLA